MTNLINFTPSENLEQYTGFIIRSRKNDIIGINIQNYTDALLIYNSFVKTLEIADDVTLEGFNDLDRKIHTLWYSYKRKSKPFSYYYDKQLGY